MLLEDEVYLFNKNRETIISMSIIFISQKIIHNIKKKNNSLKLINQSFVQENEAEYSATRRRQRAYEKGR